jgi:TP901 family phage tail tape measure protein
MAMAGWKTEDMMTSLSGVMNLAAASGEDLATVSDIVTDAMTAFGLAANGYTADGVANATHFSDVLATAASNSNTTVSGMGETFKYVGSMAGALSYDIEDVALATGLMANQGIKGTMAGTALNSILTRLSTNTSGAADAISALGVEFYNADGSARNLGDVMANCERPPRICPRPKNPNWRTPWPARRPRRACWPF